MVETRRGLRKKEEISKPEASKAVEEDSASNPAVEEASASNLALEEASASTPAVEEVGEKRNPALDEGGEEKEALIPPEEVIESRADGDAAIAAVLDSLRAEDEVRNSTEELATIGEGVIEAESVRVAPESNSVEELAEESVSLTSKNTEEDEDGGDGTGSKSVESSNREVEEEHEEDKEDESEHKELYLEANDPDGELAPMRPLGMYFPPSEYQKKMKISTRCHIYETVKKLKEDLEHQLTKRELNWFEKHPQFKHMFHMQRDPTHKVMAMWMLLLRTARIDKKKELWFVVNGVPIRYSLREHALISGLDCRLYPNKYDGAGSDRFKNKHFKGKKKIMIEDVKKAGRNGTKWF